MDSLTAATPELNGELHAALLQAAVTAALAALCIFLYLRHRKSYFRIWAAAWTLYLLRIGAIASFLATGHDAWLYWHQVFTGWTGLALLYAALVFSYQTKWRPWYLAVVTFPLVWSYVAIYRLDHFLWAAGPAVLFLSFATLWTGWVFYRYRRRVGASGATLLATAFGLWGLHHLDYPFLRAKGAWVPWGYYLDMLFALAVGFGIVLLVLDDLRRGLAALSALSGDLQRAGQERDVLDALLSRPLTLAAVRGTALYLLAPDGGEGRFVRGAGVCAGWADSERAGAEQADFRQTDSKQADSEQASHGRAAARPIGPTAEAIRQAVATGRPRVTRGGTPPYAAILPILRDQATTGAFVLVGDARDPFTALDDRFLVALGQQVGAALEHADLYRRLETRTVELAQLSARMITHHEEERRRLSRELHDETAQVFTAVKMELGVLRENVTPAQTGRLDQVLELIDKGIRSIRSVTDDLRPSLLDDLGLLPALRSLAADFSERSGITTTLHAPDALPPLSTEAELALFRALQEALSNIARHADATAVDVAISMREEHVHLRISDDGRGPPATTAWTEGTRGRLAIGEKGQMGLAGMRERIGALGGRVRFSRGPAGGALLELDMPVTPLGTPRAPEATS